MTIHIQRYIDYTLTRTSDQSPFTVRNVYIVHCTWVSYKCVKETLRSYANTESDRISAVENNVKHVSGKWQCFINKHRVMRDIPLLSGNIQLGAQFCVHRRIWKAKRLHKCVHRRIWKAKRLYLHNI